MKKYVIIPAGGEGHRAGGDLPKQFVKLLGIPMLWWSVEAFHREDPTCEITIVLHPGYFDDFDILRSELPTHLREIPLRIIAGGRTRGESVANGLMRLPVDEDALVAVHDAARPLVTTDLIRNAWECARKYSAAVPAVPVTDSLRERTENGSIAIDRSRFLAVQTPQTFKMAVIKKAYDQPEHPEFTDDASRVEASGVKICIFSGIADNIKVTNPADFAIAETLLKLREIESK